MSKRHHTRNHSKAATKAKREENFTPKEPEIPEISEEELAESYRRNTRKTIWGVVGIFMLVFVLYIFVAIDVSGCQFFEDEEEYENCQSYSLLEKILYGGAQAPIETESSTEEETSEEAKESEEAQVEEAE